MLQIQTVMFLDLDGYTASAQIRKTYTSSSVSATFGTSISANGGQVTLTLSDTVTAGLSAGRYVYDLNIESSGGQIAKRVVEGQAIVTGVTR